MQARCVIECDVSAWHAAPLHISKGVVRALSMQKGCMRLLFTRLGLSCRASAARIVSRREIRLSTQKGMVPAQAGASGQQRQDAAGARKRSKLEELMEAEKAAKKAKIERAAANAAASAAGGRQDAPWLLPGITVKARVWSLCQSQLVPCLMRDALDILLPQHTLLRGSLHMCGCQTELAVQSRCAAKHVSDRAHIQATARRVIAAAAYQQPCQNPEQA